MAVEPHQAMRIAPYWKAIGALVGAVAAQAVLWWTGQPILHDLQSALSTAIEVLGPMAAVYWFPPNREK